MRAIVATDLGPAPRTTLLASLAWPPGSSVNVLHVLPMCRGSLMLAAAPDHAALAARRQLVTAFTVGLSDGLSSRSVSLHDTTRTGDVTDEIVRRAVELHADLIIVGGPRRGGWRTRASVAANLVERAPCSVLIARTDGVRRLLLADDGTASADGAANVVARWPLFADLPVTVVNALDLDATVPTPRRSSPGGDPPEYAEVRNAAAIRVDGRVAQLARAGHHAYGIVRDGPAATELLHVARTLRVDTIVLGPKISATFGRRGFSGSVTRSVALESECSVLIARAVA